MKLPWNNLFWFQREGDAEADQLENNTTKGLLKLLQETDNRLTVDILRESLDLENDWEAVDIGYDVQKKLDSISTSERTVYLLGISYHGNHEIETTQPKREGGIPDGEITLDIDSEPITVVIEVKTGRTRLDDEQLERYRRELEIPVENCHAYSWRDIYSRLSSETEAVEKGKDRFLLKEFTEYLELMKMVSFKGFDRKELAKPENKEYQRSFMRGVDQNNPGTLALALEEKSEAYNLDWTIPVSNQESTQIHMMDREDKDAGKGFADVNHFTAGFWGGRLNFQINIRRRILGTITRRNSTEPRESFVQTMKQVLSSLDDIALTTEQNPVCQVRYQRNFQQDEEMYNPTPFNISTFAYAPEMTTEESLERRISTLAESVRESRNLGTERSFVIEKQIPFTSNLIEDENLPEHALEFFQTLEPVYHEF